MMALISSGMSFLRDPVQWNWRENSLNLHRSGVILGILRAPSLRQAQSRDFACRLPLGYASLSPAKRLNFDFTSRLAALGVAQDDSGEVQGTKAHSLE